MVRIILSICDILCRLQITPNENTDSWEYNINDRDERDIDFTKLNFLDSKKVNSIHHISGYKFIDQYGINHITPDINAYKYAHRKHENHTIYYKEEMTYYVDDPTMSFDNVKALNDGLILPSKIPFQLISLINFETPSINPKLSKM